MYHDMLYRVGIGAHEGCGEGLHGETRHEAAAIYVYVPPALLVA